MKKVSNLALTASIIVAGAMISTPAVSQKKKAEAAAQPAQAAGWQPKLTKAEAAALKPVEVAVNASDWATAATALAAAQPAATSPDARYYVGRFQLQIGVGTNNSQLQSQGIDAMIASGGGDPTQIVTLYKNQGAIALQAKDYAKAEAAFSPLGPAGSQRCRCANGNCRSKVPPEQAPGGFAALRTSHRGSKGFRSGST
jgi:hypothetical protein